MSCGHWHHDAGVFTTCEIKLIILYAIIFFGFSTVINAKASKVFGRVAPVCTPARAVVAQCVPVGRAELACVWAGKLGCYESERVMR